MRTEHDPIDRILRQRLLDEYSAARDELKQIEKRARDIVVEAAQVRARTAPSPSRASCGRMCWLRPEPDLDSVRSGSARDAESRWLARC
jgi:TPP-dependent pyruvate/acetoin dehydrogenase alpha subunit